jgi:dATP pyrophosphohydrolase
MPRAPFNVLVLPYRLRGDVFEFAVFHRSTVEMWQFVAGGGEDDESPDQASPANSPRRPVSPTAVE